MGELAGSLEHRAEALKERVYVTFTSLAVTLALLAHHEEAARAFVTLVVTVIGTVLAVFLADLVSHVVVAAEFPARAEIRHMAQISLGAAGVLVLPVVLLGLAALDVLEVETALRATAGVLLLSLVAIGFLAVRRLRLTTRQRLVVLFAEFGIGAVVVGLQLLAKG